ncbi:hypothetical protein LXL04_001869 [Taraxacum kok-saghyz]
MNVRTCLFNGLHHPTCEKATQLHEEAKHVEEYNIIKNTSVCFNNSNGVGRQNYEKATQLHEEAKHVEEGPERVGNSNGSVPTSMEGNLISEDPRVLQFWKRVGASLSCADQEVRRRKGRPRASKMHRGDQTSFSGIDLNKSAASSCSKGPSEAAPSQQVRPNSPSVSDSMDVQHTLEVGS